MTRRREVRSRLRQLGEIGEIMRSMKNLALMETRKLTRFGEGRSQTVQVLQRAGLDFMGYHPQPPLAPNTPRAVVAIGSERGFCGEFNEQIRLALAPSLHAAADADTNHQGAVVVAVGSRLCTRLEDAAVAHHPVTGATVAEDLPDTLATIAATLLQTRPQSGLRLEVLYHGGGDEPALQTLLPPFFDRPQPHPARIPPLLYLAPDEFYRQWLEHYLLAVLQAVLQQSLLSENERRVRHLEGALQRLDEKTQDLARRSQSLRQEEITEEIEIILLSAEGLRGAHGGLS